MGSLSSAMWGNEHRLVDRRGIWAGPFIVKKRFFEASGAR
jgi:hypothetical protein